MKYKQTLLTFLVLAYTGVFSLFVLGDYIGKMYDAYGIPEDSSLVLYVISIERGVK